MYKPMIVHVVSVIAFASIGMAEVQVNERTSGAQANPAVAGTGAGQAVIVWSSYYSTAGRSNDILARRLDPNGAFLDGEFVVNAAAEGNQTEPAVAMDTAGRSAVVWQSPGLDEEDIFLRLVDPNGTPTTEELLVNLRTRGRQICPSVAAGGSTVVVAYESREQTPDGETTSVYAQLFDLTGEGLGAEILANHRFINSRYPDVAMNATGDFVVTWLRETGADAIEARLFDPNGVPISEPLEVSTDRITSVTRPSIAMNPRGDFVIAWDGDPNRAADDDIHARLYRPDGTPQGEPFLVNSLRDGAQQWPQVAMSDANEFLVVWEHDAGDPNVATEIFARRFDPNGLPMGEEFPLNTYALDKQRSPDVAVAGDGSFLVVWDSNGQDGSSYGVFAHIERPATTSDPNAQILYDYRGQTGTHESRR